jgi:DGQHR domain-containing protein
MSQSDKISKLKTSWTKYDCVRVIEIIGDNDLLAYLNQEESIDPPVLKSYLGISSFEDTLPYYWNEIQKFPRQKRLFTLAAGIFTHHKNIEMFADSFSTKNMLGEFRMGEKGDKHMTNLRSALVVSGAAKNSFRRKPVVPFDISNLFEEGELGIYFKDLLHERLKRIGYSDEELENSFLSICYELSFDKALSLEKDQFKRWMDGKRVGQVKQFDYQLSDLLPNRAIQAFKVNQWLEAWEDIDFSQPMRRKPDPHFFIFNIDIRLLKRLSDIHRRRANKRRSEDTSVQRGLEEKRSQEIRRFVQGGFPWSTLSDSAKNAPENEHLKMPGILPTAIVANIIGTEEKRGNNQLRPEDAIKIMEEDNGQCKLEIPETIFDEQWDPDLKPIEIIDGQHRLMAFDETEPINGKYEVPVVAYYNLDRAWQAYLFYVINIKPKKINTSLGYDLYPLLRTQSWLENSKDGLAVYRETRAQELVEALWIYDQSPWHNRINMLGANEGHNISQAAFIRALSDTYLKRTTRKEVSGLFADVLSGKNYEEIRWVRAQQAAFLILLWEKIAISASDCEEDWAIALKTEKKQQLFFDAENARNASIKINDAFLSRNSMLSRDQGVTGISMFTNDFFFVAANQFNEYDFNEIEWKGDIDERQIETNSIDKAIEQFRKSPLNGLIKDVSKELMRFDWRTSNAFFEDEDQQEIQKKFKGTGGYREVWKDLLKLFTTSEDSTIKGYAQKIKELSNI